MSCRVSSSGRVRVLLRSVILSLALSVYLLCLDSCNNVELDHSLSSKHGGGLKQYVYDAAIRWKFFSCIAVIVIKQLFNDQLDDKYKGSFKSSSVRLSLGDVTLTGSKSGDVSWPFPYQKDITFLSVTAPLITSLLTAPTLRHLVQQAVQMHSGLADKYLRTV